MSGLAEFEHALLLLLLIAGLSVVGRWLPWPQMITYIAGGVGAAFLPGFPRVQLDPGFFFVCFLPPLLFADGWLMPIREFLRAKRPILTLAIGLVAFTTLAVGYVAHFLVPGLSVAMAMALGAVVSPTDAVAVSAITERLKVPNRLSTVLSGESLMNDATGLVAFKFAIAACVVGGFSLRAALLDFVVLSSGGFLLGLAVSYAIGKLRDLIRHLQSSDPTVEATLSLMTPYAAYLLADRLGLSAVLSVVAAGLYAGWRDPVRMDVEARQTAYRVWETVLFWLNGLAFLLLGLQFPSVLAAVSHQFSGLQLLGLTAAVAGTAMVGRLLWMFPGTYVPFLLPSVRRREVPASPRAVLVCGWAGMRGAVTLAAALSIPLYLPGGAPFPGRDIVIFLSFGVIATTLLVQGTTLEALIRALGLREDETRAGEERLARMSAVEAGLEELRALEAAATTDDQMSALGHVIAEYELRLAELASEGETRASARERQAAGRRYHLAALRAERDAINRLWHSGAIIDEVHHPLLSLLDHEETVLVGTGPEAPAEPLSG